MLAKLRMLLTTSWFNSLVSTSPVVSVFRAVPRPGFGVEWRADYDARRGGVTNSSLNADMRLYPCHKFDCAERFYDSHSASADYWQLHYDQPWYDRNLPDKDL